MSDDHLRPFCNRSFGSSGALRVPGEGATRLMRDYPYLSAASGTAR